MKKTVFILLILIIAAGLRIYKLPVSPPGLYPDEAMNGNNALESLESRDWKVFYPENFGREGLFINIQSLLVGAFGNQAWVLRLPSALIGIFTVLGLYLLTKELYRRESVALLASFFLATSFWHIIFSRIGFRAILAPFFLIWGLYFLFKSLNANRYALSAVIGGLIYGLGFYSYIAYRATPLLIAFSLCLPAVRQGLLAFKYDWNRILKVAAFFSTAAILIAAPLGIYFLQNPQDFFGRTTGISIFNSQTPVQDLGLNILKTVGMFNVAGDFNWRHNIAGRPLLFWPVGIFFIAGIILGIKSIFRKSDFLKFPFLFLFSWLIIGLLPVVISNEGLPHALRSIIVIPPIFILASIGAVKIYELLKLKFKNRRLLVVGGWLFFSLLAFEAYYSYFGRWTENPNVKTAFTYRDTVIARQINSLPKEQPKYAVISEASRKIERDYPISLQSILFLTDTFTNKKRQEKNIYYLTPEEFEKSDIPENAFIIKI